MRFVIVALFENLEVGARFGRDRWPAHVTLVANFVTDAAPGAIADATRPAASAQSSMVLALGGVDRFGPGRDIPVRLVMSESARELHHALADALEPLRVEPDEASYWRDDYRPHLTLSPTVEAAQGERRRVRQIALVRLDGDSAMVAAGLAALE